MNLVLTLGQVPIDVAEALPVVKEPGFKQLEALIALGVLQDSEDFNEGFLVAGAALRPHSLVVEFGSDVGFEVLLGASLGFLVVECNKVCFLIQMLFQIQLGAYLHILVVLWLIAYFQFV